MGLVSRSLVAKVYLYAAAVLVVMLAGSILVARVLLDTGRLDSVRQFGRDNALFIAREVERSGTDARRLEELSKGLHATLRFVPWKQTGNYPALLASDKLVYEPGPLPGPSWHRYWVRLDRGNETLGALLVDFEPPRPFRPAGHLLVPLAWMLLLALLIVPPLWFWVLRPLRGLVAIAHRLGAGDLATPVAVTRSDELADLEHAFESLRQRVLQMLRQKEQLLADISHELRGPLSRMAVAVPLLQTPPEDAPTVARLEREIQAMDGLIGELLTLARAQSQPTHVPLDLAGLARELVDARELTARQAGLTLEAALAAAPLQGDPRLLARAMGNMLDNALKYTPTGGHVRVETAPGCFRVLDDGPGVAPADLPHLFEPFYRPDTSRSRETGGVGLGLAIARAIAEGHGGTATLASGPAGTVAELRLPG
ncbi:MAG: two-component sensor histidine kinase [Cyanobacteria bacterium RYN_339]|nr:two-component sensor histidine kinase [Cyanobacteria bacterium RYN_339]